MTDAPASAARQGTRTYECEWFIRERVIHKRERESIRLTDFSRCRLGCAHLITVYTHLPRASYIYGAHDAPLRSRKPFRNVAAFCSRCCRRTGATGTRGTTDAQNGVRRTRQMWCARIESHEDKNRNAVGRCYYTITVTLSSRKVGDPFSRGVPGNRDRGTRYRNDSR